MTIDPKALAQAVEALPRGQHNSTHWQGCWRHRDHHACAVKRLEGLTRLIQPLTGRIATAQMLDGLFDHDGKTS